MSETNPKNKVPNGAEISASGQPAATVHPSGQDSGDNNGAD